MTHVSQIKNNIVQRLFLYLVDLEKAITVTRASLSSKDALTEDILDRLECYTQILASQRRLTYELAEYLEGRNLFEVTRRITLINALSGMIISDAKNILESLSAKSSQIDNTEHVN